MLPSKIDEMLKNNMTAKGYEMVINIDTRLNPQWERAASSTGKYHRTSDGTSQTIAEHTGEMLNAAIKIMKCLRLTKNTGDCDSFLMSIALHDVRKYTYVEQRHTNKRHDTEMANILHFNKDKLGTILNESQIHKLEEGVRMHGGIWSSDANKNFDLNELSAEALIVHILDMLSCNNLLREDLK